MAMIITLSSAMMMNGEKPSVSTRLMTAAEYPPRVMRMGGFLPSRKRTA